MEIAQKVRILEDSAKYDICASCGPRPQGMSSRSGSNLHQALEHSTTPHYSNSLLGSIYYASTPQGLTPVLKTLLSNKCLHNCQYCINAKSTNIARAAMSPEELANTFIHLKQKNLVKGLFLSSAVEDTPEKTMAQLIKTAELLRYRHQFKGFIHLKIMPGASAASITQACKLATRASINIEAPNASCLSSLSKTKNYQDILRIISTINNLEKNGALSAGQTTQFVIGASGETDRELIKTSAALYRSYALRRIYFSAFTPIEGTPLENVRRTNPQREHRLYQCDYLMRQYGFKPEELVFSPQDQLPLDLDPKLNFALNHPELFPVEINSAPFELLLKVPGIGPKSAHRLIQTRKKNRFQEISELKGFGLALNRAKSFLLINGKKQFNSLKIEQMKFNFSLN